MNYVKAFLMAVSVDLLSAAVYYSVGASTPDLFTRGVLVSILTFLLAQSMFKDSK